MPVVEYPRQDHAGARRELQAIATDADADHPLGAYLVDSAQQHLDHLVALAIGGDRRTVERALQEGGDIL